MSWIGYCNHGFENHCCQSVEPYKTEKCPILRLVTPTNWQSESCKQHTFWKLKKLNYSILACGLLLMAAWCMRLRPDSSCFISWDICDLRDSSENTATKPLWAATFNPAGMFYKTQTWWTRWWVIVPFGASGHTGWYVGHKHIFVLLLWWSSTSKQIKFSSLQEPIASLEKVKDDFSTKTQTKTSHIKIKFQWKASVFVVLSVTVWIPFAMK